MVDHLHLLVEAALLRQEADPGRQLAPPQGSTEEGDPAFVGLDDVHDHPDGGALPGAVRPEQAEDHTRRDLQREAADRRVAGESLGDPFQLNDRLHRFPPWLER